MKKLKLNKHNNECVCITEHNNNSKRGISYKQYQPYHQQLLTDRYNSLRTTQLTHGNYSSSKSTDRYTVDVLQGMNNNNNNNNEICSYINNINLKLRLDINKNVPIYVDKYNLTKTVEKFTISNYNNKYNIYYKKHQNLPSIRSINRTSKYNIWQSIFIQSLRDKQRNELQPLLPKHNSHHYKHKSDLPYIHL